MVTSAARGWRWPTGADQGLVAVSCPGIDGWKDDANAIAYEPRAWTTACGSAWTAGCAMTGFAIIVDRIAATPRSLKFVIVKSLHVVDPARMCADLLIERLSSDF